MLCSMKFCCCCKIVVVVFVFDVLRASKRSVASPARGIIGVLRAFLARVVGCLKLTSFV